jgi:ribosomal protein L40E
MEKVKVQYIMGYYGHFMTAQERLAGRHLSSTYKATHGRTDVAAQAEVRNSSNHLSRWLSNDPEVLQLASEGMDLFNERTAERIFNEHASEIVFNNCPRCGALAKTPKAQQCRSCRHDWHPIDAPAAKNL